MLGDGALTAAISMFLETGASYYEVIRISHKGAASLAFETLRFGVLPADQEAEYQYRGESPQSAFRCPAQ